VGEIQDKLEAQLKSQPGPFLFVGAGFSRRYADLPNWEGLLRNFAALTPHQYEYSLGIAGGRLPKTASQIAEDFYEVWWSAPEYEAARAEDSSKIERTDSALKIEVARFIRDAVAASSIPQSLEEEWQLLQKSTIDGVITTNYDSLLSRAFPDFELFVGQDELLFADTQGIAEIYMIHGSVSAPETLILTQADYDEFQKRNTYLAAKLLTLFVEHPVIFLGYSLGDDNIKGILSAIVAGLRDKNVNKLQQRLIFVEWDPNSEPNYQDTVMLVDDVSIPITRVRVADFIDVFKALGKKERAISAKLMRILKEQIYEIICSNDPRGRLHAYMDIDSENAKDWSIVFGVGAKIAVKGIVGLSRAEVLAAVVNGSTNEFPSDQLLTELIDHVPENQWYPVYMFLRDVDKLDEKGRILESAAVLQKIRARADKNREALKMKVKYRRKVTMSKLEEDHGWEWMLGHALELPSYTDDVDGFQQWLRAHADRATSQRWMTQYAKAVVAYDYLRFGPQG
jgi:hypothetical protein